MNSEPAPEATDPITASWRARREFLSNALQIFGTPGEIARRAEVGPQRNRLIEWLRGMEAVLRHLLLLEAARLPKQEQKAKALLGKRLNIGGQHGRGGFGDEDSANWRGIRFNAVQASKPRAERRDEDSRKHRYFSPFAIAERFEAIIRVFNDPAPHVERLARHLWKKPAQARNALKLPPYTNRTPGLEEIKALAPLAEAAILRFYEPG